MQSKVLLCLATVLACAYAQVYQPSSYEDRYPETYLLARQARHPRDLSWDTKVGQNGKFGAVLGSDDDGLFGKAGYSHKLMDNGRGTLTGEAYGKRVLGPYGDSTSYGGKLNWDTNNFKSSVDLNRQIGGGTSLTATGLGDWKLDKNTHFQTGGFAKQDFGQRRPEIGIVGGIKYDW